MATEEQRIDPFKAPKSRDSKLSCDPRMRSLLSFKILNESHAMEIRHFRRKKLLRKC